MNFLLHPTLRQDTITLGDLPVCRLLLMNDKRFPWLILVPRRASLRELYDLHAKDYRTVMEEVRRTAHLFSRHIHADKMNVAALGNMVPQLHIHVIARFRDDDAWPKPVWSLRAKPKPYGEEEERLVAQRFRRVLLGETNITKM